MLKLKNVSVSFDTEQKNCVVEDISMELPAGSRTAIIGETGSGKSVLLLAILQLLPSNAHVLGSICLDEEDLLQVRGKRLREIRGGIISYIPQGGGGSLNPLMTVGYQVGEPLMQHRGYTKKQAILASIPLLRQFHLSHEEQLARAYPHTFSGGMRQRAMVAMGISAGASILLADEPTKGLDYNRIDMVAKCFESLEGKTLLCVTHDINFARRIGDRIVVMYAAQQLEEAERQEFFSNPLHPYSRAILDAMPENGLKSGVGFAPSHENYENTGCRFASRCPYRTEKCGKMPPIFEKNGHKVRCWLYE